ncbi:MAG: hypothetical protein ACP5N1_06885 [Candidatus Woesearchaeota archaeon]
MNYSYVLKLYYDSIYNLKNVEENIQMIVFSVIGFFIPFILQHPQIIIGILVNVLLIVGATYLKGHKILPLILLPSIGALTAGILFDTYTIFLLYLIPFIWLGNIIYVYTYKYFNAKNYNLKNNFLGLLIASILKAGFLLTATLILVKLALVPEIFLTAMGLLQLVTALAGGFIAIGIIKIRNAFITN